MMRLLTLLLLLNSLLFPLSLRAELLVIAHADNLEVLNENHVRNLFLGKAKTYPSGMAVNAYDLPLEYPAYKEFVRKVLKRNESNLNAYWARMLFSSQGRPPERLRSNSDMLQRVSSDVTAIGYILAEDLDSQAKVRIVLKIP